MMSSGMHTVHKIAWVLVVIGAVNWGLVGIFDFNLVEAIFGGMPTVERVVYALVGVSGLYLIFAKMQGPKMM